MGVEIKTDRRDWIREKDDPEKADAIGKYCDRWWIVTPPGIVKTEELPPAWGLMEYHEDKSRWKYAKPAEVLKAKPLNKEFLVSILRRVAESSVPVACLEERVKADSAQAQITKDRELDWFKKENVELKQRIKDFEEASGVSLGNPWSFHGPDKIGEAVLAVLNGADKNIASRMHGLRHIAGEIVKTLDEHLVNVPKEREVIDT